LLAVHSLFLADLDQRRDGGHSEASYERSSANDLKYAGEEAEATRRSPSQRRLYVCSCRCFQEKLVCPSMAMAGHRGGYA
jgi:hypothetical protein